MRNRKVWILAVAALLCIYIGASVYYSERFFYNTTVHGVNLSNLTVEEGKKKIQDELVSYTLVIHAREQDDVCIKTMDIDLQYDLGSVLEDLKLSQNMWTWPSAIVYQKQREDEFPVVFQEEKLEQVLNGFSFYQKEHMREPKDAHISEYKPDVGYEIVAEDNGTSFDKEMVRGEIRQSLCALQPEIDLENMGLYEKPQRFADNAALLSVKERMNTLVATKILYVGNTAVDGNLICTWIREENDAVVIDEDRIREFVIALADKYDTLGKPRTFLTSAVGEVELPASKKIGWQIDQEAEFQQIRADLETGQTIEREPMFSSRGFSLTEGEFGKTYVEIDLTNQHLYYYKDGQMILDSPVVTGNVARGRRTPPGIFTLRTKMKHVVLRGRDYAAPVTYWMPFNGGIGLHDATWRGSFGGEIYRSSGSHGCVNMPKGKAKSLYENIEAGCPVVCYTTNVRAKSSVAQFQAN